MNYDSLYIGIYLCILMQLVLLTIVNAFQKSSQNRILAIICFLFIVSILKIAFWTPLQESFFYWIIGGSHLFLFPVVLFLYISSITQNHLRHLSIHWLIPLVVYVIIHPIKLAFFGWPEYPFEDRIYDHIIFLPFFIFYSIESTKLLKKETSENLNLKIHRRFKFFYYSVNIYLLANIVFVLPLSINIHLENAQLREFNFQYIFPSYLFIFRYLFAVPCIALLFYALTEISLLKRHIVNAESNVRRKAKLGEIEALRQMINQSNFYLNPSVNVHSFMKENSVNRQLLKSFLEYSGFSNFNEMVNSLRVEEFKRRIALKENHKYDLVSVAKESGFNSKASFYRVFKQLEGITPNQYQHNQSLK